MDRLSLLKEIQHSDDQVLETDTMRFVAIIGIIFWIIFSVIKAIPLQTPRPDLTPMRTDTEKPDELSQPQQIRKEVERQKTTFKSLKDEVRQAPAPDRSGKSEAKRPLEEKNSVSASRGGLHIEFRSLNDLFALMHDNQVRIFFRARTKGFYLIFEGLPNANSVAFKRITGLPSTLWEIQSGKHHAFFLDVMAKTYPVISRFPDRQVFVSFVNKDLENHLELKYGRLQREGKEGVLSIDRNGNLVFDEFEQIQKEIESKTDTGDER